MKLGMLAAGLTVWAAGAAAQSGLNAEYQPLVAPLDAMIRGCLDQGHDDESYRACGPQTQQACHFMGSQGATTLGFVMCAALLGRLWNEELARSWAAMQDGREPGELEGLRAEQAAWEAYRDAACDFAVADVAEGTMAAHVGGDCRVRMTSERVAGFREILRYR